MCEVSMDGMIEFKMIMQKILKRLSPKSAKELAEIFECYTSIIGDVCDEYVNNNNGNNDNNTIDFTMRDFENAVFDLDYERFW